jgi:hypothetical protein
VVQWGAATVVLPGVADQRGVVDWNAVGLAYAKPLQSFSSRHVRSVRTITSGVYRAVRG